jgi:DNA polymerase-3 subunit beta
MATAAIATPPSTEKTADASLMEFAVDRTQFLSEVAAAARVTDGKSTQPLLSHLLLRATGGGLLSITGSDLKRTVTTECPAAIKTFGEATVSAQSYSLISLRG